MKKLKEMAHSAYCRYCIMMALACCMLAGMALASDPAPSSTETIQAAFTSGFTTIVSDATAMIAAIVPIALGLAGLLFVVKKAIGWFKSIAK